jgi:hypothetical protein
VVDDQLIPSGELMATLVDFGFSAQIDPTAQAAVRSWFQHPPSVQILVLAVWKLAVWLSRLFVDVGHRYLKASLNSSLVLFLEG